MSILLIVTQISRNALSLEKTRTLIDDWFGQFSRLREREREKDIINAL